MSKKQKLELTWIGKDEEPRLEPRVLIEDPEKSYGDRNVQNLLIHGDNLLALKALEQDFAGKIKCIYIDPPYNTGNAFEHYEDGLEHSIWLGLIRDRLDILRRLLSDDGSIFVQIDDNEQAYLKVLMDEIFGRANFVSTLITKATPNGRDYGNIARTHEYIHVYRKTDQVVFNKVPAEEKTFRYRDEKGEYNIHPLYNSNEAFTSKNRPNLYYPFYVNPNKINENEFFEISLEKKKGFIEVYPPKSVKNSVQFVWRWGKEKALENLNKEIVGYKVNDGFRIVQKMRTTEKLLRSIIEGADISNRKGTAELEELFNAKSFPYPKPEALIEKVIYIATNEGDYVLDSFLGSGTTASVAHKMGRLWIGIELGNHCYTHCIPRLKKVCDGTDQGGISKAVNWKGGGGFKFYELAPSLLKKDKYDNWIIDERYNADMLAAAMAKHEGFKYSPSDDLYWKQGQSTEKDFIFTTTQMVTASFIDRINEEMKDGESLLICCKSYQKACENRFANITIKKIPNMLLGRCEFGKEDYSLNIIDMPRNENESEFVPAGPKDDKTPKGKRKSGSDQATLF